MQKLVEDTNSSLAIPILSILFIRFFFQYCETYCRFRGLFLIIPKCFPGAVEKRTFVKNPHLK